MAKKKKEAQLDEALLKVALGFEVSEITEEYAEVDGALKLTKRKKTKKDIPPDLKAVQMLLAAGGAERGLADWSDEELEAERLKLLDALNGQDGAGQKQDEKTKQKAEKKTPTKRRRSVVKKTVKKSK